MPDEEPLDAYVHLADQLIAGQISESDLQPAVAALSPLNKNLLDRFAHRAESFAATRPRDGWAIMQVARELAYAQHGDLFLRSLADWNLGRACNRWTQPKRVREAISAARRGFEELHDSGWLAACNWQLNALSWTRSNFGQAAQTLQSALIALEQSGFSEFIPECRLDLAYAQILIGEHDVALENIRLSEEAYLTRGDQLNRARCWLHQASSLRRQDQFDDAYSKLKQALNVFEKEAALADQAKAHYQIGLVHLMSVDNLTEAVVHFTKSAELFDALNLDLWRGMCINDLGSVYLFTGDLSLADKHYHEARDIFAFHEVTGLLADNLNDNGEVNILKGKPQASIEQFKQSTALHESLGLPLPTAIGMTNLGKAYGQSGRYQDALYYLEQASERLEALKSHLRLGTCEKYKAFIWSQLNQPYQAHESLDRAIANYELARQKAMVSEIYNFRAHVFFQQGRENESIDCLKKSLDISISYGVRPQVNLARRLLGEALIQTGRYQEALDHLEQARADFSEMGMLMDQAASLVAAGTCYVLMAKPEDARNAFQQALELSKGVLPEIEWRALIGLGNLAESRADISWALQAYQQAMKAFARIRQNFWQPTLAGSYLQKPAHIFDKIISTASKTQAAYDSLLFIEQSKASILPGQLLSDEPSKQNSTSQELNDMEAEIRFLQDQLRVSAETPFPARAQSDFHQTRTKLNEKTQQYEALKARLERHAAKSQISSDGFSLSLFRESADRFLQKNWVALDYYLLDEELIVNMVTTDRCEVLNFPTPYRFRLALDTCKKAVRTFEVPTQSDLDVLGQVLIPALLGEYLEPETSLLLVPHKELHHVPWAALRPGFTPDALIHVCTPTVIPSLQSLIILWQRNDSTIPLNRKDGLLVGLSSFEGKRRELPYVKDEITFLGSKLGLHGEQLIEKNATWENLLKLGQDKGLARFAWLHMASHFFSHPQTGRLSGFTLRDGDVWLDKLRDLVPLPRLVTLSACNSISSFVYEGDEHVDLPTACLVANARCVVGSLWPVQDQTAAEFTRAFYTHYFEGMNPARAVAQAQREMSGRDEFKGGWMSFVCIGVP